MTYIEVRKPALVTKSWNWYRPHPILPSMDAAEPVLDPPATLRIDLTEATSADGSRVTTISVEHSDLPIEWVEDFRALWRWNLAMLRL